MHGGNDRQPVCKRLGENTSAKWFDELRFSDMRVCHLVLAPNCDTLFELYSFFLLITLSTDISTYFLPWKQAQST